MLSSLRSYVRVDKSLRKKFRCLKCGRCCEELIIGPVSTTDMARIVKLDEGNLRYFRNYLRYSESGRFLMSFKIIVNDELAPGGCAFFDKEKRRCKIYKYNI